MIHKYKDYYMIHFRKPKSSHPSHECNSYHFICWPLNVFKNVYRSVFASWFEGHTSVKALCHFVTTSSIFMSPFFNL